MRTRLETLKWLYGEAESALKEAPADRKSALIGQLRGIAAEIDELQDDSGVSGDDAANPLEVMLARRAKSRKTG